MKHGSNLGNRMKEIFIKTFIFLNISVRRS